MTMHNALVFAGGVAFGQLVMFFVLCWFYVNRPESSDIVPLVPK